MALRAKEGGEPEFAALLARYLFLIKSRASFYDTADTEQEDLVQEGTLGFLQAVRTYDPQAGASFRTYAGLCIDRSILSAVRRALARRRIPATAMVDLEDAEFCDPSDPENRIIAREQLRQITESLDTVLSDFERSVLLRYAVGESYGEIAAHLSVTPKAVGNALHRVRKKING